MSPAERPLLVALLTLAALAAGLALGYLAGRRHARTRVEGPPLRLRGKGGGTRSAARSGARSPAHPHASPPGRDFSAKDLEDSRRLLALSSAAFEEASAEAFRRAGWAVRHTGGIGDRGVDLVVERGDVRAVVQVKHRVSGKPVDVRAVRELHGVREDHGVERAVLVSSSGFTPEAREYARKHDVWLVTLNGLRELSRGGRAARPSSWDLPNRG